MWRPYIPPHTHKHSFRPCGIQYVYIPCALVYILGRYYHLAHSEPQYLWLQSAAYNKQGRSHKDRYTTRSIQPVDTVMISVLPRKGVVKIDLVVLAQWLAEE